MIQGNECWCSNYQPADTVDLSDCSAACPGYGPESCSSAQEGTFRYILIGNPSGTASVSSASSTISQSSQQTSQQQTSQQQSSSSSSSSSQPPVTKSAASSASSVASVITTESVVFESLASGSPSAQIKTVYITATTSDTAPTPSNSASSAAPQSDQSTASSSSSSSSSFFDDKGKVAGVFTVVALVIVGLIAGLGFFCYRRRKSARAAAAVDDEGLSDATLSPQTVPAGWEKNAAAAGTSDLKANGSHGSSLYALMGGGTAAAAASKRMKSRSSPTMRGNGGGSSGDEGSLKRPERSASNGTMIVDQRLDPSGLGYLMRFEDEGEDELSSGDRASLRDDEDYGRRVWRVTNRGDEDGRSLSSIDD